ncbi:hypothetical protein LTR84_004807 [Exophiala bonariae]|uniref:Uncharacterized protein n=1 Tax=Exophiala bonariae TaxID=1690606 RepID=A0AAV9NMY2_9EURO|nr:hypothetical protein LTR84_004807 [Exophiala bonariae]
MAALGEMQPPPPPPIQIRQAVDEVINLIVQIRHKLTTMINWYIYPEIVPSEIKAYEPRLIILQERLRALGTISYEELANLVDGSDGLASQYLLQIVEQLLTSVIAIEKIFANHYDPELHMKRPMNTIWYTLDYRGQQLRLVAGQPMINPRRLFPEDYRGVNVLGNFCRGAVQILNNRDRGKISFIEKKDLKEENSRKLRDFGGAFLYWECADCAYKVRYHVSNSMTSNIHTTDEFREQESAAIQYRSSFLARSHLYLPLASTTLGSLGKRESLTISSSTTKYGCLFCASKGKELKRGSTAFARPEDLAEHIGTYHRKPLPPSILLHKYLVAIAGKMVNDRLRWDLNFL